MTWLGEDRDTSIMAAYNFNGFNTAGSDYRMLIRGSANGFRMYNMTFHNLRPKASGNNQAEIIKHSGQQSIVRNCKFMSFQDTVCLNGQMYLENCYLEGDTDYIWGYGTVYFDRCEMHSLSTQSYITQPRTAQDVNGFLLVDCNLTSPAGLTGCYLGRTTDNGYPYCQSVFINCTMPKTLILGIGWRVATGTDLPNLRWWEYQSAEPNGTLIDVNMRAPYSRQITDDNEAAYLRDVNNILGAWHPKALGEFPTPAWQPGPIDGATGVDKDGISLTWAAGAEATSHIVNFGTNNPPDYNTEQTGTSFATGAMLQNTTYYWRVDENNPAGTTVGTVWSFTTYNCTSPIVSDLDSDCQVDFLDYSRLADAWAGNPPQVDLGTDGLLDFADIAQFAADWLSCHRDPDTECWQ
jgi:hypothetical protein